MHDSLWSTATPAPDTHVLFRGRFQLEGALEVEIRVVGASWYQAWLDGLPLLEGPLRFALERPEYQAERRALAAGEHVLAFHAHHVGEETRMLRTTPPFLWCKVVAGGNVHPLHWLCRELASHQSRTRRINPQLGWMEWRDTRQEPAGFEQPHFDDADWSAPCRGVSSLPEPRPADLASVATFTHALKPVASGPLAHTFGYAADDPSFAFHIRDRVCARLPAKGQWRRYDLGRVRLGRPGFRLRVPPGAVVEMALAESLGEGRVSPYIPLSCGASCNLDHYVARGGEQVFCPLTPKGGRFLEVHVINAREVEFLEETFLERCAYAPTEAAFACGDPVLERVWEVGIETLRACAEDGIIDNPTRERGQWIGDSSTVGLAIAGIAYHDLRPLRRGLVQAALAARDDGLVAGLSPGGCVHLPTSACHWAAGVVELFRLTGDHALLEELWPAAERNLAALRAHWHPDGLHAVPGWNFIDWGWAPEAGPVDTACSLLYLGCLQAMATWAHALGRGTDDWVTHETQARGILVKRVRERLARDGDGLGYHATALALRLGLIDDEAAALDRLARHWLACFPNDPAAPRNDDPLAVHPRVITPYFAHFVLPLFFERGRADFALDQIRRCWGGYLLADERTTWLEVFDERWSHCHHWSGCPTWQLSRYLLGLRPRCDRAIGDFDWVLQPGSIPQARGRLPHPAGGWMDIRWERDGAGLRWRILTDKPVRLRFADGSQRELRGERILELPGASALASGESARS